MKDSQVQIDKCYVAKVSNRLVTVRVMSECRISETLRRYWPNKRRRFNCKNLRTGRFVELTAAKLRREVAAPSSDQRKEKNDRSVQRVSVSSTSVRKESVIMSAPKMSIKGNKLTIEVSLAKNPSPSKSGKTLICASTHGFVKGPKYKDEEISLSMNVTIPNPDN